MPKFLKRDALRAGRYVKRGQQVEVTAGDCRRRFESLRQLDANGLHVPLLLEHTDPAKQAGEGLPGQLSNGRFEYGEAEADQLRRTVGSVDLKDPRSRINESGGIDLVFDVPDEATAKQLRDSRIRFVSPELRSSWTDGVGRTYEDVLTHVALTHRPIQVDQAAGFEQVALSDVRGPVQLSAAAEPNNFSISVADFDVVQFDDFNDNDEDDGGDQEPFENPARSPATPPPSGEQNPNMPKSKSEDAMLLEAINAHLMKLGVRIPEDTSPDDFMRTLLTALMTKVASEDQAAAKAQSGNGGNNNDSIETEEQMPTTRQFSSDSLHGKLLGRITRLRNANALPAGLGDQMLLQLSGVEFDHAGREKSRGGMTLTSLCELYESQATQFSDGSPQARLAGEVRAAAEAGFITPGERDQLLGKIPAVQFSDNGQESNSGGGIGIRQFLGISRQRGNVMKGILGDRTAGATATQFSDGGDGDQFAEGMEAYHPNDSFISGDAALQVGDKKAKALAREILARTGLGKPKQRSADMTEVANMQMSGGGELG